MRIAGIFNKVSFQEFSKCFNEVDTEELREIYENIKTPQRATHGSAGYDFYAPFSFELAPGESVWIPTGINVLLDVTWCLLLFPRSGLGSKYRCQLDNTVGVIDTDYCYSDNEGHIMAKVTNDSKDNKTLSIEAGQAFMQGVFVQYGTVLDDEPLQDKRNGGFGSTDEV